MSLGGSSQNRTYNGIEDTFTIYETGRYTIKARAWNQYKSTDYRTRVFYVEEF